MKKRFFIILILAVVCMVVLGITIYTKKQKNVITENGEETYYTYKETELGTELNPTTENYTPTEGTTEELEAVSDVAGEGTLTFTGTIIDHSVTPKSPTICVKPPEDIIPYESVFFVLPDDEVEWASQIGSVVIITCADTFTEEAPHYGTLISIVGWKSEKDSSAVESENQTEEVNSVNPDELADVFGISISLPENPNWIVNSEYHLIDDNNLEITYHDLIADSDCIILVAKNENLTLPENEYDERLDESWEGRTINGQNIMVKVQRGKNGSKTVLATWEYNEYQFAIIGEIEGELDSGPIAKVALSIIRDLY